VFAGLYRFRVIHLRRADTPGLLLGHTLAFMDDRDQQAAGLRAEGYSFRAIAKRLGMSLGAVQRALQRAEKAPAVTPSSVAAGGDPVVALLTNDDLAHLGVSAGDVLNALDRYRFLGLPEGSAAGDAARRLFDHGRNDAAFTAWLYEGAGEPVPVRGEPLPAHVRDKRIVELRREGWNLADIGAAVHMSEAGVSRALQRLSGDPDASED
jgi:lambda repressor-like predicted transcriptional regulator